MVQYSEKVGGREVVGAIKSLESAKRLCIEHAKLLFEGVVTSLNV